MNTKAKLTILVIVTSLVLYFIQTYVWTDAGKTAQSKSYAYSYQINQWSNDTYAKFERLRESGAYENLDLSRGNNVVSVDFFSAIHEYHRHIKSILRTQKFNSRVSYEMLKEIDKMGSKGLAHTINPTKIRKKVAEFKELLLKHKNITERLDTYLPELISAFEYDKEEYSESEIIELSVEQLELLRELYSSDYLFLKRNTDVFKFIRDLGNNSYSMLSNYEQVLLGYNKQISTEDSYKKVLLFILTLVSFILSIRIALIPETDT